MLSPGSTLSLALAWLALVLLSSVTQRSPPEPSYLKGLPPS